MDYYLNLTECYLSVARSTMVSTSAGNPSLQHFVDTYGANPLVNAILGIVSITIIYSYLALESFVNAMLYNVWEGRNDGSSKSRRFRDLLGHVSKFIDLKSQKRTQELGERIKTLCAIHGYEKPHEVMPQVWQEFKGLAEASRHFIVHPYPEDEYFQRNADTILNQTPSEKYIQIVEQLISFFYDQAGEDIPSWVTENNLFRFTGVEVLCGKTNKNT